MPPPSQQEKEKNAAIIIVLLVLFSLQSIQSSLIFDHEKIVNGEYWRLISGNFVHVSYLHTLMNAFGILLLRQLFKEHLKTNELITFLPLAGISIGTGLYVFSPDIQKYAGFSGILYGYFFYTACLSIYHKNYHYGVPVVIVVCGKTFYEKFLVTPSTTTEAFFDMPIAIDAHLYGLIFGFIYFLILILLKNNEKHH
jgi:rhomboid family GlyGly-CTERM serine protease